MKLSVWQQFSSNHSAAFSIVAKFESAEKAKAVAAHVTEMLLETYLWNEYELSRADISPAQVRQEFENGAAFGTTWMLSEEHLRRSLQVIGNAILVSDTPGYSNFDGSDRAFIKLLSKFGGEVIAAVEEAGYLYMNFSADAENEEAAKKVLEDIGERKYGTEFYYFQKDSQKLVPLPPHAAKEVRQVGKRLHFNNIFMWAHFFELSSWYNFAKTHGLSNIVAEFVSERDSKRLSIELDEANVMRLFWDAFDYHKDRPENEHFALAEFTSSETAETAAKKLCEILLNIQAWSQKNPKESHWVWEVYWERLSPVEEALKLEYGIEWPMSAIEWIHHCKEAADFIVVQYGRQILLGNLKDFFVGVSPFHKFLEKMEGFVAFEKSQFLTSFDFILTMPTNSQAEAICVEIKAVVEDVAYPWMPFHRNYGNFEGWQADLEKLKQHDEKARRHIETLRPFVAYSGELKINHELTDFLQKLYEAPQFFDEEIRQINRIARDCEFDYRTMFIRNNQVHIHAGSFSEARSCLGLEAFLLWLKSKGAKVSINLHKP
jgi:hypothetical protein